MNNCFFMTRQFSFPWIFFKINNLGKKSISENVKLGAEEIKKIGIFVVHKKIIQ